MWWFCGNLFFKGGFIFLSSCATFIKKTTDKRGGSRDFFLLSRRVGPRSLHHLYSAKRQDDEHFVQRALQIMALFGTSELIF
jgi:hypothetical protein